jgi:hypothetical protein
MVAAPESGERVKRPRGVFVRRRDELSQNQVDLLDSIARLRIDCASGSLAEALNE